jgi:hypothetical protein
LRLSLSSPEYVPHEYPRIWSIFQHALIPVCTVRSVAVESVYSKLRSDSAHYNNVKCCNNI